MWRVAWPWVLDVAVMVLAAWLLLGCSAKKIVEKDNSIVHDTVYMYGAAKDSVRWLTMTKDSVRLQYKDSIVIVRDTAGKTIQRYEWHWADRGRDKAVSDYKARARTDTLIVYRNKTDTAYVTRTITAQAPKRHRNWLAVVLMALALMVAAGAWMKLRRNDCTSR